jgi:hypothetical protein
VGNEGVKHKASCCMSGVYIYKIKKKKKNLEKKSTVVYNREI